MFRARHGIPVLVAVLTVAGCAGAEQADPGGPSPGPAPSIATFGGTQAPPDGSDDTVVPQTLAFQASTVDGAQFDAATLAGAPVAFWFWAAWCTRCAAAAEGVRAVQAEYAGSAHVVGVAGLGSGEAGMRDFVDRHGLDAFPQLSDDDGQVWQRFGVVMQEYFVLLDDSGAVVHEGPLSAAELRDQLASLTG